MKVQKIQSNNTNFGAKLDVTNLNNARWNQIAKKFAQATKKYPKDTIKISIPENRGSFEPLPNGVYERTGFVINTDINNHGINVTKKGYLQNIGVGLLTKLEDNAIVEKLVKLHKIFRTESDICIDAEKFRDTFFKGKYKDIDLRFAELRFNDAINEARNTSIDANLWKDDVLARLDFERLTVTPTIA